MRRSLLYAAVTNDDDNAADGDFSAVRDTNPLMARIYARLRR